MLLLPYLIALEASGLGYQVELKSLGGSLHKGYLKRDLSGLQGS